MNLSLKLALRFLKSNKGQTVLIISGIAVAVAIQLFIGLLIKGLQISLVQKTTGNTPQITITSTTDDKLIKQWEELSRDIQAYGSEYGLKTVTQTLTFPVVITFSGKSSNLLIRGFNFERSKPLYDINNKLIAGNLPAHSNEVLIGDDLAKELGIKIGDKLNLFVFRLFKTKDLYVSGIFDFGVSSINKNWLVTTLENAQMINNSQEYVSAIEITVEKLFEADKISTSLREKIQRQDIIFEDWKSSNEELLSGLNGQSISSIIIQVFVIISVCLGIASVLIITVLQKSKEVGILKAMGLKDSQASLVFLSEGFLLGMMGAIAGIVLGIILLFFFTTFAVNSDGSPVVPIIFDYTFIIISGIIAVAASTISAILPAKKSSKLSPVEVIRNG
ncbi:MAG: ABC transporter permease [Petrotogaceae bacterium]|nr:ABC transporter permease [Petrotogaceae bacterium]